MQLFLPFSPLLSQILFPAKSNVGMMTGLVRFTLRFSVSITYHHSSFPTFTDPITGKPLTIPPNLTPLTTYTHTNGEIFDFYEITIKDTTQQVYPNLQATKLQGYNGLVPGPVIRTTVGRRSVVRFINKVTNPASIHLHGSPSRPVFDGWAEDLIKTNQYKDYVFPNEGARTLW